MKANRISMTIGLTVVLTVAIPITLADKKMTVVAGTEAATIIGGALWYKLHRGKVIIEFDGEKLNVDFSNTEDFITVLKNKGLTGYAIIVIREKIASDINRYFLAAKRTILKFSIKKQGDYITMNTKLNNGQTVGEKLSFYNIDNSSVSSSTDNFGVAITSPFRENASKGITFINNNEENSMKALTNELDIVDDTLELTE